MPTIMKQNPIRHSLSPLRHTSLQYRIPITIRTSLNMCLFVQIIILLNQAPRNQIIHTTIIITTNIIG